MKLTIKKLSFLFLTVFFGLTLLYYTALANTEKIYVIEIHFISGVATLGEIITKSGYAPKQASGEHDYSLGIEDSNGVVLIEHSFSLPLEIAYDPPGPGEEPATPPPAIEEIKTAEILPYFENGAKIKLYYNSDLIDEKDIRYLARVCGDKVCQENETSDNCPADCPVIDLCYVNGQCDGLETPQNCPKDCLTVQPKSKSLITLSFKEILIILSLAIIAVGIVLGVRYRKRFNDDN